MISVTPSMSPVERLLDENAAALRCYLRARCGDAELTNDLMQEVALRLVRAATRLDEDQNPRGYLFRTAANVWRDHLRRELVRRDLAAAAGPVSAPPPDAEFFASELQVRVRAVIATLPREQRQVVELRHGAGLKFREIAQRLGRPLGTVLGQMRSALQKISEATNDYR